jgi:hypothetical protein
MQVGNKLDCGEEYTIGGLLLTYKESLVERVIVNRKRDEQTEPDRTAST